MPPLLGTRRVPYLAGAWTPARLPGLVLWLDAATVAQADNTSVARWPDRSGLHNDATQGTVAAQPTYLAAGLNGRPALSFEGVDDSLVNTVTSLVAADSAHTVLLAGQATNATGGVPLTLRLTTTYSSRMLFNSGGNHYVNGDGVNTAANVQVAGLAAITSPFLATWTLFGGVALNPAVALNGATLAITSSGTHQTAEAGTTGFQVGSNVSNQYWPGTVGTLLVYSRALATADRYQVEAWLSAKYSVAVVRG